MKLYSVSIEPLVRALGDAQGHQNQLPVWFQHTWETPPPWLQPSNLFSATARRNQNWQLSEHIESDSTCPDNCPETNRGREGGEKVGGASRSIPTMTISLHPLCLPSQDNKKDNGNGFKRENDDKGWDKNDRGRRWIMVVHALLK